MRSSRAGFTVMELMLVIVFLALAGSSALFMFKNQEQGTLEAEAQGVVSRVREARARAQAGVDGLSWGVHFENATTSPFYAIFPGGTYVSASSTAYYLSSSVGYGALPQGSSTDIIFTKLSGGSSVSTTIVFALQSDASKTETLLISSEGNIRLQ